MTNSWITNIKVKKEFVAVKMRTSVSTHSVCHPVSAVHVSGIPVALEEHSQHLSMQLKIENVLTLITSYTAIISSGRRSSFHDWAPRQKRRSVLQHQWQTRNYFQPGQRPCIRSDLSSICFVHTMCVDFWGPCLSSGILVNGQIIGDKQIPPDGVINTYFCRFGITHWTLGVRLEVDTEVITVYQGGERIKLLWSEPSSLKGPK